MPKKLPPRVGTEDIEPTLGELPSSAASNSASTASMAEEGEAVRSDDSEQLSSLSFVDVGNLKGGNFADPVRAKKPVRLHQPPADTIDETFTQAELDDGHTDSDAGGAARPSAADLASAPTGVLHRPSAGSEPSLPHLEDRGVFARGGFGSIHRVNDLRFHRDVAMKVLESSSETSKVRFRLEGQVTAQLQHPNIVPVFEGGRSEDGTPFFTMQLVEGETLKRRAHNMDLHQVLEVMLKVCDAVAYAHARGVIHRDLKPENIMLGDFGQVYVMDWGIALVKGQPAFETQLQTQEGRPLGVAAARSTSSSRLQTEDVRPVKVHHRSSDPTMDRPGTVVGTASYMAPEQAMGRVADIDERTDVFGLGGILYYVITGEPLYAGNTTKERIHKAQQCVPIAPEVRSPDAKVPPGLRALCLRALSKNRDDRPQTVDAFRRQLESLLRGGWWFDTVSFRTDDLVVRDGDDGDCAYIITVGTAEVFRAVTDDDGQTTETVLGTLGPGDVFGETAILTDSPRSASVRATSSMTAMVITR